MHILNRKYPGPLSIRIAITAVLLFLWLITYMWGVYLSDDFQKPAWGKFSVVLLLAPSFILLIRTFHAKNIVMMVFFAFMTLYALVPKYYFFDRIKPSFFQKNMSDETMIETTLIFSLFMILLNLFCTVPRVEKNRPLKLNDSPPVFWMNIVIICLITAFAMSGENVFTGGGYATTYYNKENSFINEYVIIFILIAYLFSGGNKFRLRLLYVLSAVYCLKNLLTGGRIETVMVLLLFLVIRIQYLISFKVCFLFFIAGVWVLTAFNAIRGNPELLINGEWEKIFFAYSSESREYLGTNEGDVFYASERLFIMIHDSFLTIFDRLYAFACYLVSSIVPYSKLPSIANLALYGGSESGGLYLSGGGGMAPIFFYVFLSFPGVILFALFIAWCLKLLNSQKISGRLVYGILIVATLPRWFAYYPSQIIKLCIFGIVIYLFFRSLASTWEKHRDLFKRNANFRKI